MTNENNMEKLKDNKGGKSKIAGLKSKSKPSVLTFEVNEDITLDSLAYAFPSQSPQEYRSLIISTRHHGQLTPVTSWLNEDGTYTVANGRHRVRACKYLGLEVKHKPFDGTREQLEALVEAENEGRMLSVGQRAMRAILSEEYAALIDESKEKRIANLPKMIGRSLSGEKVSAKDAIAKIKGCSKVAITKSLKVQKHKPEFVSKVLSGSMTLEQAFQSTNEPKSEPEEPKSMPKQKPKFTIKKAHKQLDMIIANADELSTDEKHEIVRRLIEMGNELTG